MTTTLIAFLIAIAIGLLLYLTLVPRNTTSYTPEVEAGNKKLKLLSAIGDEFNRSLPKGVGPMENKREYPRITSLLKRSGNPWNLKPDEFVFMQWTFALLGFALAWPVWWLLNLRFNIPWFVLVIGLSVLFYFYPKSIYADRAKKRDLEFKRQLPEALDLMIISLSAGTTFSQALRDSIPNMQNGVLKDEFAQIDRSIKSGKSLETALTDFGERAPNEAISSFVKAVKEATKLDVPIIEILEARSAASRQDFFALIYNRTAKLTSKMMLILTPTLIPALLIIAVLPSLMSLLSSLGG